MNTDRPIQPQVLQKNQRTRLIQLLAGVAALTGIFFWLTAWISPSVKRSEIRTARVESGAMEATINGTGTIVPEFEQVLSSPIDTRILKILKKAGDTLRPQEPILLLDLETAMLAYEKVTDQLALKKNAQRQLHTTTENQLIKLNSQIKVKELDLQVKKMKYEQHKPLYEGKYISKNDFDVLEMEYESAMTQLQELKDTRRNVIEGSHLQLEGLELEVKIYNSERTLLRQELELATTQSDRNGVLTWVTLSEGATIRKGDLLARIADLKTYRVDATLSDIHASHFTTGMPVRVKIADSYLNGTVSNIMPTIENGVVRAYINLDEKSHAMLRSNLRVDVYVVTDSKSRTLKVKKGVFASTEGKPELFVIRDGKAVKTRVQPGLSNAEYVEIVSGLKEGDEVILSNMSSYAHLEQVRLMD
jgi:HlyD family secretion protein